MVKAVLDTNIWMSGFFFKGKIEKILALWENQKFLATFSNQTFLELKLKLLNMGQNLKLENETKEYLYLINKLAVFVYPKTSVNVCEDPEDNKFFDVASEAKADYIVSGDKKVQKIGMSGVTKVVSPRKFVEILTNGND